MAGGVVGLDEAYFGVGGEGLDVLNVAQLGLGRGEVEEFLGALVHAEGVVFVEELGDFDAAAVFFVAFYLEGTDDGVFVADDDGFVDHLGGVGNVDGHL